MDALGQTINIYTEIAPPNQIRLPNGELGGRVLLIDDLADSGFTLKAVVDKSRCPVPGDHVGLRFDTERVVLFDATTERLLPSQASRRHREQTTGARHGQH